MAPCGLVRGGQTLWSNKGRSAGRRLLSERRTTNTERRGAREGGPITEIDGWRILNLERTYRGLCPAFMFVCQATEVQRSDLNQPIKQASYDWREMEAKSDCQHMAPSSGDIASRYQVPRLLLLSLTLKWMAKVLVGPPPCYLSGPIKLGCSSEECDL